MSNQGIYREGKGKCMKDEMVLWTNILGTCVKTSKGIQRFKYLWGVLLSLRKLFFQISTKSYMRKESMLLAVEIDDLVGVRQNEIRVAETLVFEPSASEVEVGVLLKFRQSWSHAVEILTFYISLTVHLGVILVNNQLGALFSMYLFIYFTSVHV